MTFDPAVPNANQSPGLAPAQLNTNFTRLKALINADHVFNDTTAADDGAHKSIVMVAQTRPTGSLAAGTNGTLYNVIEGPTARVEYYNGSKYYLMSTVMATVSFNNTGAIQSQFNVTSVTLAAGIYTITFTTPLPNPDYIVQVTGMGANTTQLVINGAVAGNATFGNSVAVGSVKVAFYGPTGISTVPLRGYVTIFSVV